MSYVSPKYNLRGYTCPHCGAFAEMVHQERTWNLSDRSSTSSQNAVRTSQCRHCGKWQMWHLEEMVYPVRGLAPPPNPETPEEVLTYYEEAARVSGQSPRAAAALL